MPKGRGIKTSSDVTAAQSRLFSYIINEVSRRLRVETWVDKYSFGETDKMDAIKKTIQLLQAANR